MDDAELRALLGTVVPKCDGAGWPSHAGAAPTIQIKASCGCCGTSDVQLMCVACREFMSRPGMGWLCGVCMTRGHASLVDWVPEPL